ncbi:MAG: gephyrin-like molybdotransferase Glp [Nitrososphaeraceae archaeon]
MRSKKSSGDFISVESAFVMLFSSFNIPKVNAKRVENVSLLESNGRVLAENLYSPMNVPPFDRSDRDGFAISSSDTANVSLHSPIYLKIIGKGLAGQRPISFRIRKGQALEIATGAKLPKGADSVIMFEDTLSKANGLVKISKPVNRGGHVSYKGSDVTKKQLVLKKGTWITPQDVALIASMGFDRIHVVKKPKVGILATGDELTEPGSSPLNEASIFESNRYMVSCLVQEAGGDSVDLGLCKDDPVTIFEILKSALKLDMIVVSGGASVGEKDYTPALVNRLGKPGLIVHGIAMKPGSPTGLGIVRNTPIIICPGFPVSAYAAFSTFGSPILYKLLGTRGPVKAILKAKITKDISVHKDFLTFVRVIVYRHNDIFLAKPVSASGPSLISTLTNSNGIVIVNSRITNSSGLRKGEVVEVTLFKNIQGTA